MRDEVEVLEKNQAILKPQIFFSYIQIISKTDEKAKTGKSWFRNNFVGWRMDEDKEDEPFLILEKPRKTYSTATLAQSGCPK